MAICDELLIQINCCLQTVALRKDTVRSRALMAGFKPTYAYFWETANRRYVFSGTAGSQTNRWKFVRHYFYKKQLKVGNSRCRINTEQKTFVSFN